MLHMITSWIRVLILVINQSHYKIGNMENEIIEQVEPKIINAQQILDIILPIPKEHFIAEYYGITDTPKSCFLGHIHRELSGNPDDFTGDFNGYGARELTARFLQHHHTIEDVDGTWVNNEPTINGYTEPEIKDRVVHMLEDMIKAGY